MTIEQKLLSWCTDWDGSPMVPGEPPRDGLHCDDLYEAITEIERLRAEVKALREQDWDALISARLASQKAAQS